MGRNWVIKNEFEYENAIKTVNKDHSQNIGTIHKELLACEKKLASMTNAPLMTQQQRTEKMVLEKALRNFAMQFNQAKKNWLKELLDIPRPGEAKINGAVVPKQPLPPGIPWPTWVGNDTKSYVEKSIKQGGLHVTDSVSVVPNPFTSTLTVKFEW